MPPLIQRILTAGGPAACVWYFLFLQEQPGFRSRSNSNYLSEAVIGWLPQGECLTDEERQGQDQQRRPTEADRHHDQPEGHRPRHRRRQKVSGNDEDEEDDVNGNYDGD